MNETEAAIVCPRKIAKKMDIANELQTVLNRHTMLQLRIAGNEAINDDQGAFQQLDGENADEPAGQVQIEGHAQIQPQH